MATQQAEAFINDLNSNQDLQKALKSDLDLENTKKSEAQAEQVLDKLVAFANEQGYDFTAKEYKVVVAELQEENQDALSEDELQKVAGGGSDFSILSFGSFGIGCAVATIMGDCDNVST